MELNTFVRTYQSKTASVSENMTINFSDEQLAEILLGFGNSMFVRISNNEAIDKYIYIPMEMLIRIVETYQQNKIN